MLFRSCARRPSSADRTRPHGERRRLRDYASMATSLWSQRAVERSTCSPIAATSCRPPSQARPDEGRQAIQRVLETRAAASAEALLVMHLSGRGGRGLALRSEAPAPPAAPPHDLPRSHGGSAAPAAMTEDRRAGRADGCSGRSAGLGEDGPRLDLPRWQGHDVPTAHGHRHGPRAELS